MNRVILIGNLARNPELSTTPNGVSVCKITLAVQRRFTNGDGERVADFFNCVLWRGIAESTSKYLHKGDKAGIVGNLQTRTYEDKDGVQRYVTEIVVEEIEFLNSKNNSEADGKEAAKEKARQELRESGRKAEFIPTDEDLPF